jgi:hypothetical protein
MYMDPLSPEDHDLAFPNFNNCTSQYQFKAQKYSISNSCANLTKPTVIFKRGVKYKWNIGY